MVDFLLSGRKLDLGPAIDDGSVSPEPEGGSCSIHGNIAASNDAAFPSGMDRGQVVLAERLHEIVPGEEFVGGKDSVEVLTRDAHESWQAGSCAHENSLETFIVHQTVDCHRTSDDHIRLYLDSESLDLVDLALEDSVLRETELRDAIFKDTSCLVESFEYGDVVAFLGQVGGARQSCRAASYDCHLRSAFRNLLDGFRDRGVVGDEAFKLSDSDRLALDSEYAGAFALGLLRAYTAADGRKGGIAGDYPCSPFDVTGGEMRDEFGNIHTHRAGRHTARILAVQATGCLSGGFRQVITITDFFEIMCSYLGILLPDRYSWDSCCHLTSEFFLFPLPLRPYTVRDVSSPRRNQHHSR